MAANYITQRGNTRPRMSAFRRPGYAPAGQHYNPRPFSADPAFAPLPSGESLITAEEAWAVPRWAAPQRGQLGAGQVTWIPSSQRYSLGAAYPADPIYSVSGPFRGAQYGQITRPGPERSWKERRRQELADPATYGRLGDGQHPQVISAVTYYTRPPGAPSFGAEAGAEGVGKAIGDVLLGIGGGAAGEAAGEILQDPRVQAELQEWSVECKEQAKVGVTEWMQENWGILAAAGIAFIGLNWITLTIGVNPLVRPRR